MDDRPRADERVGQGPSEDGDPGRWPPETQDDEARSDSVDGIEPSIARLRHPKRARPTVGKGVAAVHPKGLDDTRRRPAPNDRARLEHETQAGPSHRERQDRVFRGREPLIVTTDSAPGLSRERDAPRSRNERIGSNIPEGEQGHGTQSPFPRGVPERLIPTADTVRFAALEGC